MNVGDFNPSTGAFTKLATMGGGESSGLANDDAAMVAQGATLYLTYVNWLGDLFVTWSSTPSNVNSWSTDDTQLSALYGATGTVAGGNHLWIAWTEYPDLLLDLGQYN